MGAAGRDDKSYETNDPDIPLVSRFPSTDNSRPNVAPASGLIVFNKLKDADVPAMKVDNSTQHSEGRGIETWKVVTKEVGGGEEVQRGGCRFAFG